MNQTIGNITQLTNTPTVGNVRRVVKVAKNETANDKMFRLISATVRKFAEEYPDVARQIVSEVVEARP